MIDIALDSLDNWTLGADGNLTSVDRGAEVAQACKIALRAFKGEYFLDQNFGIDLEEVTAKPFKEARIDREVRRVLRDVTGVRSVKSVTATRNSTLREIEVTVDIVTIYGDERQFTA